MADSLLDEAKEAFRDCEGYWSDNYRQAAEDRRFVYLSDQWPQYAKEARRSRPMLTFNLLGKFVRLISNEIRQNRPSITVIPVDGASDPEVAEVLGGIIKHIESSSNADVAYDTAAADAVVNGFGFWRINIDHVDERSFDKDLVIRRIRNPLSVMFDPDSTAADSSDWNLCFVTQLLPRKVFQRRFPKAIATSFAGDAPHVVDGEWFSGGSVRLAEWWTREQVKGRLLGLSDGSTVLAEEFDPDLAAEAGLSVIAEREVVRHRVRQRLISGAEVLEEVEWPGTFIPIIPVFGGDYDIEGRRHLVSLTRDAQDAQRLYNYMRSAQAEMAALQPRVPFIGPKGAFDSDAGKWARINDPSISFVEYDPVPGEPPPSRVEPPGVSTAFERLAINAAEEVKSITGIYDASLGAKSNETSGRAIVARQRQSDISVYHFVDNVSRAIRHTGVVLLDLIPRIYNVPRIVRIIGDTGEMQEKAVNVSDGVEKALDLTVGRYDVRVKSGPSYASRREQAAIEMTNLIQVMPDVGSLIGDIVAESLDWPGADRIAKRLRSMLPPSILQAEGGEQAEDPRVAQLEGALQKASEELQNAKFQRELELEKLKIEAFKAETDRIQVIASIRGSAPDNDPDDDGQGDV